jgi:hypothetical protein
MELVRGEPLDLFVRQRHATHRHIVALLAAVTDAVHHAHLRGVVHRDLKPANVLVVNEPDAPPRPTILDFGIARLTERGRPGTLATSAGQILGTLAYMSPEQLTGDPATVDQRTDVYALGVILYELLAGRLPLDVRDRPIADAARILRDEEPTRLGSVDTSLRGDLETIVSKAIEKDPARRYPSAQALGDELRRYLSDEPILARPTTRVERLRRFARRNRAIVAGTTATILALLLGTVATAIFATRAVQSRDAAQWLAYRANVAAASAAFAGHDMGAARRFLESAPAAYRGWEWRYLATNLDRATATATMPGVRPPRRGDMWPHTSVTLHLARNGWTLPEHWPVRLRTTNAAPTPALTGAPTGAHSLADIDPISGRELWMLEDDAVLLRAVDGRERRLSTGPLALGESVSDRTPAAAALAPDGEAILLFFRTAAPNVQVVWYGRLDGTVSATVAVQNFGRHFAIAMGPGNLVALGGGPDRLPIVWHPADGSAYPLRGHLGDVNALAISHDGSMVATGGADRSVRLFDARSGAPIAMVREHLDQVTCLAFTPDDAALASGSYDHTVRVWSSPSLTSRMVLDGHRGFMQAIEWTPDGAWLLSYDDELAVRLWPSDSGAAVGEMHVADNACGMLDFALATPALLATNGAGLVRTWDLTPSAAQATLPMSIVVASEPRVLDSGAIAPDGLTAVGLERESQASIYRRDGEHWSRAWDGADAMAAVGFTAEGRCVGLIADGGSGAGSERTPALGRLRFLPESEPVALPLPTLVSPTMRTSPDGSVVALRDAGSLGQRVRILDAASGQERFSFRCAYGGSSAFCTIEAAPLNRQCA